MSDPEAQRISIVDLTKTEDGAEAVVTSYELPQVPNEIAVASGAVAAGAAEHGEDNGHEGHDHGAGEGHDHEDHGHGDEEGHESHDH